MKPKSQGDDWIRILNHNGVKTEYAVDPVGKTFRNKQIVLLPFRVSVRRIPTGNFLKRHPSAKERSILERLSVEFLMETNGETLVAQYHGKGSLLFGGETNRAEDLAPAPEGGPSLPEEVASAEFLGKVVKEAKLSFMTIESRLRSKVISLAEMTMQFGLDEEKILFLAGEISQKEWETIPSKKLNTHPKSHLADVANPSDPHVGERRLMRNQRWEQARGKSF